MVGDSSSDGTYKTGRPDLNPATLIFQQQTTSGPPETYGILFSLFATSSQLCHYLARLCNINPSKIRIWCKTPAKEFYIENDSKTLAEYQVLNGATVATFEKGQEYTVPTEAVSRKTRYQEEEKKAPMDVAISTIGDEEEEMLRLAIEASLRDFGRDPEGEIYGRSQQQEEEKVRRIRIDVPPIQIRMAETDPDEPEKPKTPSTGIPSAFLQPPPSNR